MPTLDFVAARSGAARSGAAQSGPTRRGNARVAARDRRPASVDPVAVVQLNDQLWRITRPEGDVLGYIEAFTATGGIRFRAKRFLARQRRFMIDGEFWAMDDALECFRSLAA